MSKASFAGENARPENRVTSGRSLIRFLDPAVSPGYAQSVMLAALQRYADVLRVTKFSPEFRMQYLSPIRAGALALPPEVVRQALRDENVEVSDELVVHAAFIQPGGDDDPGDTYSHFAQIGVDPDKTIASGKGVTVALLDSGTPAHADLRGSFADEENFTLTEPQADNYGHATHCAGLIAGPRKIAGEFGYGVAPNVKMLYGRVLDRNGDGLGLSVLAGIVWALRKKADLIVMCFSSPVGRNARPDTNCEIAAERARESRTLIIAAAGNKAAGTMEPVNSPANCIGIPAAGAVDRNGAPAAFSCVAEAGERQVEMLAPGELLRSSFLQDKYRRYSGTSMACAVTAGVAALWAEKKPDDLLGELLKNLKGGVVQAPS